MSVCREDAEGFGIRNITFRNVTVNGKDLSSFPRTVKGEVKDIRFEYE